MCEKNGKWEPNLGFYYREYQEGKKERQAKLHHHQPGTSASVIMLVICFLTGLLVVVTLVVVALGLLVVVVLPGKLKSPPDGTFGWNALPKIFQPDWGLTVAPRSIPPFGRAKPLSAWLKMPLMSPLKALPFASSCLPFAPADEGWLADEGSWPAGRLNAVNKPNASFGAAMKIRK